MKTGDLAGYEYDFGDGWEHEVAVKGRRRGRRGHGMPRGIAGEGACPPEDCGGPGGFAELKELLAGPPSLPNVRRCACGLAKIDHPAHFDLAAAEYGSGINLTRFRE